MTITMTMMVMTTRIGITMMRDIGKPCAELLMSAGAEMALADQGGDDDNGGDEDSGGDDHDEHEDDEDEGEGGQGGQRRPHQDRWPEETSSFGCRRK